MLTLLAIAGLTAGCADKSADPVDTPSTPSTPDTSGTADTSTPPEDTGDDGPLRFSQTPTNILVIGVDTTRRDKLGRFSGDPDITPNLDALMREGVVLEDHRSCSNWTWDSVLCLQTGRRPWELGFEYVDATGIARSSVPSEVELVSEVVSAAGYQTALVTGQSYLSTENRMNQGFDETWFGLDAPAADINSHALLLLEHIDQDQPWYLHLHYMDPHELYDPPEAYLGGLDALDPIDYDLSSRAQYEELRNGDIRTMSEEERALVLEHLWVRYLGELKYFDDQLGALMAQLEADGWLDDTLVMFWTDHGEQIWQHDYSTHGGSLYDEENRSAVFFWSKALTPAVWTAPTTHMDLWPTLFDALALPNPPVFTGVPLGERGEDAALFGLRYRGSGTLQSVVVDDMKLTFRWNGEREVYDLTADPGELINLYSDSDPTSMALWELMAPQQQLVQEAMDAYASDLPDP